MRHAATGRAACSRPKRLCPPFSQYFSYKTFSFSLFVLVYLFRRTGGQKVAEKKLDHHNKKETPIPKNRGFL
jgi:hypothetical protein